MVKGYVRPALREDVPVLAENLREADIAEIRAASGRTPEASLLEGVSRGVTKVACLPDDTPAAIFGVVPVRPQVGAIWMVATTEFKTLHRQFLREYREELRDITKGYSLVFNYTDARNTVHHRWIRWAGFTIIQRHENFGHEGRAFLEFVRITEATNV